MLKSQFWSSPKYYRFAVKSSISSSQNAHVPVKIVFSTWVVWVSPGGYHQLLHTLIAGCVTFPVPGESELFFDNQMDQKGI